MFTGSAEESRRRVQELADEIAKALNALDELGGVGVAAREIGISAQTVGDASKAR